MEDEHAIKVYQRRRESEEITNNRCESRGLQTLPVPDTDYKITTQEMLEKHGMESQEEANSRGLQKMVRRGEGREGRKAGQWALVTAERRNKLPPRNAQSSDSR